MKTAICCERPANARNKEDASEGDAKRATRSAARGPYRETHTVALCCDPPAAASQGETHQNDAERNCRRRKTGWLNQGPRKVNAQWEEGAAVCLQALADGCGEPWADVADATIASGVELPKCLGFGRGRPQGLGNESSVANHIRTHARKACGQARCVWRGAGATQRASAQPEVRGELVSHLEPCSPEAAMAVSWTRRGQNPLMITVLTALDPASNAYLRGGGRRGVRETRPQGLRLLRKPLGTEATDTQGRSLP